jgi:hypothetical protein
MTLADGGGGFSWSFSFGGALAVAESTGGPLPRRNSMRDIAEKRDDCGSSALFLQWGKIVEEALGRILYMAGGINTTWRLDSISW